MLLILKELIEKTPKNKLNEPLLYFAKNHAEQAMAKISTEEGTLYNLDIFWDALLSNEVNDQIKDLTMNILYELIKHNNQLIYDYIEKAGKNILCSVNVEISVRFLMKIDFTSYLISIKAADSRDLSKLTEFITNYQVLENVIKQASEDIPNSDIISQTFTYSKSKLYLEFIRSVSREFTEIIIIDEKLMNMLWDVFYVKATLEKSELFFEIMQFDQQSRGIKSVGIFTKLESMKQFMQNYLDTFNVTHKISIKAFKCFEKYFKISNDLQFTEPLPDVNAFLGIKTLWNFILINKNSEIREKASKLLIRAYKETIKQRDDRKEIITEFLNKLLEIAATEPEKTLNSLNLLELFIFEYFYIKIYRKYIDLKKK